MSGERGGGGGSRPIHHKIFFSHQLNLRFFLKKTIIFQDSREGPTFPGVGSNFTGGGGGQCIRIQITCDFPGGGFGPPFPFGSSHENSLFRCFAHGLKMCMSCALDIIVKLFSLSLFYELVIQ